MLTVRKARQADVTAIGILFCEYVDFHARYDPSYKRSRNAQRNFSKIISSQITNRNALVLVAVEKRKTVGFLHASIAHKPPVFELEKFGSINDLAVAQDCRRSGIGTALYKSCLEWFRGKNITRIESGVTTSNPVSNRFWKKMGYRSYYAKLFLTIS